MADDGTDELGGRLERRIEELLDGRAATSSICPSDAARAEDPGLPPDTDPVAVSVLTRARRLATVLDLALADSPGAAVTAGQMAAREQALRPLSDAVREATTAVWNWLPR
ncbi:hypothetical protein GCM10023162_12990 [Klenkia terrae]